MAYFELTLKGYRGDSDETDHLVLWVDTDMSLASTKECLAEAGLYQPEGLVLDVVQLDGDDLIGRDMKHADFVLPRDINELGTLVRMLVQLNELANADFDSQQALAEGWDLFDVDGRLQLQRLDCPSDFCASLGDKPVFKSDADAIIFVALAANEGSAYHRDALERIGTLAE
jgi:hypothetical protein